MLNILHYIQAEMMIEYTVYSSFITGVLLYLQVLAILRKMLVDGKISVRIHFSGGLRRQTSAASLVWTIPLEHHGVHT